jgi:hypothetical protein
MELAQRANEISKEQESVADQLWKDLGLENEGQEAA